jgi:predicted Zn-dependent protease
MDRRSTVAGEAAGGRAGALPAAGRVCRVAALLIIALPVLAGCEAVTQGTSPTIEVAAPATSRTISSPEASLGAREHPRLVTAYGGVYSDAKAERAVARIVGKLVAVSDDPSRTYRVTILNSPAINAFALPGGYIYVTRGLLALAEDSSEVAAVLAHEMAHVTAQHAVARQRRAEAAAVVNRVAANVVQDQDAARQAIATTQLSLARFTQTQELEADEIGVKTLSRAGFDPFAASRFLTAMGRFATLKSRRPANNERPDFLSSHPATPERIALAVRAARQFGSPDIGERDRDNYLNALDGLLYGDDPREGFVRGRAFLHRELGIGFTVPNGFTLENTSKAVLASDGGNIAMRFDGVDVPESMSLTDYLASGWVSGLIADSVRTLDVGSRPAATASAISGGWSFRIGVVRTDKRVYRFIFATASPNAAFEAAFTDTVRSFRVLSPAEVASLKPLRIDIVRAGPGDTIDGLAARMQGIDPALRRDLFVVLNEIDPAEGLKAGSLVKLVTE